MQEKILLAPGAKASELLKSLALHGINCFNLRIYGSGEFARTMLMRSGVSVKEEFLSTKEECTVVAKAVAGESYFGRTTYSDIKQIANAIRRMRSLVVDTDEETCIQKTLEKGIFAEKNVALFRVYQKYMTALKNQNLLDSVSLMKKALGACKEISAEFYTLKEYPLSPLDKALIDKVSGGKATELTLLDLYAVEEKTLHVETFRNCYGSPNEVEMILDDIYAGKKLDQCVVAMADAVTYSQLFFDYALLYDIPVTFGCGLPIINSNPARLLVLYYHWITGGFYGRESLEAIFESNAFNRSIWREQFPEAPKGFSRKKFYEVLGGLRLMNDETANLERIDAYKKAISEEEAIIPKSDKKACNELEQRKLCLPFLDIAARELALPPEDFIAKYAYIRKGAQTHSEKLLMKLDLSAARAIYEELGVIRKAGIEQATDDLIMNVLKVGVCGEKSEAGKLHITDIRGALSCGRENLYIAGLAASNYPGSPKENYLLLDEDLGLFGDGADYLTSDGKITVKKDQLYSLVHLAASMNSKIYISYAGLNVSDLKRDNASSMIFEMYREECGKNISSKDLEEKMQRIDYFEPAISATREIGKAFNAGSKLVAPPVDFRYGDLNVDSGRMLEKEWSPSAINLFQSDPVSFKLKYMLGIPVPEEKIPYDVISPISAGNLAHMLMQRLADSDMKKEEFLELATKYFDCFVEENPPVIAETIPAARTDFLEMMESAYDRDPHREVVLKEEDIHCVHPSGVKIYGYPDRVEKLEDGTYAIVDFKSGRTIRHQQDDIDTCLQVVIYAYMMEQQGYNVSRGEFRYIRSGECVTCKYDDEMKAALEYVLTNFRNMVQAFSFDMMESDMEEA